MMKPIRFGASLLLAFLLLMPRLVFAQSYGPLKLPGGCGTANYTTGVAYLTVDSTGKLCSNSSATLTGFRPTAYGTPISVTTGGVTGTLPAGSEVVATNVGTTNGAYCALGGTATTSNQYIAPNGGWFAFAISGDTQLTCITSTSTTTVNMAGGSGLPTGTGGGGGGSGGGGVVTNAGTFAVQLTGATNNINNIAGTISLPTGAATVANQATEISSLATIATASIASVPYTVNGTPTAATALTPGTPQTGTIVAPNSDITSYGGTAVGAMANFGTSPTAVKAPNANSFNFVTDQVGGGIAALEGDPCQTTAKSYLPITLATAAVKVIATGVSAKKIYVCQLNLNNNAADTVAVFEATTATTCATSAVAVIGAGTSVATAGTGYNFGATGGISLGNGASQVLQTANNANDLCIAQSAATQLSGSITYVTR